MGAPADSNLRVTSTVPRYELLISHARTAPARSDTVYSTHITSATYSAYTARIFVESSRGAMVLG